MFWGVFSCNPSITETRGVLGHCSNGRDWRSATTFQMGGMKRRRLGEKSNAMSNADNRLLSRKHVGYIRYQKNMWDLSGCFFRKPFFNSRQQNARIMSDKILQHIALSGGYGFNFSRTIH